MIEWISVQDRLPEPDFESRISGRKLTCVLAWSRGMVEKMNFYEDRGFACFRFNDEEDFIDEEKKLSINQWLINGVTHWAYINEPS